MKERKGLRRNQNKRQVDLKRRKAKQRKKKKGKKDRRKREFPLG